MIRRGFLAVESRRVHYRWAGSGPPIVLLHGSPGDSEMFGPEMSVLAQHYTAIAFDTPGFGLSDQLPGDVLTVADLARATAEAMAALGLPPCRVYGSHTGAAIGLELGVGWPDQVSGLLLEGVPIFTEAEMEQIFAGYFAPMIPDPLGGHLTSTWVRFRDQFTWFPWCSRDVTRLNPLDRPSAEDIHGWVAMFYRSCATYSTAYRAACFYGQQAVRAAAALEVATIYTAAVTDMLHPHLDRLPKLKPGQRIAPFPAASSDRGAALLAHLQSLPGGAATHIHHPTSPVGTDPALCFVPTPDGDVLVRSYGNPAHKPLLVAHDAPGSGLACQDIARALAKQFHVLVPDLPGCGQSAAPSDPRPILGAAATALLAIADHFALPGYAILGLGCGASVAATLATLNDPRLIALLVNDMPTPDPAIASAIAPPIPLSPEGAHWVQAWLMLRDGQIYRPWCAGTVAAQRRDQGNFDAQWLHDETCALMAARTSYHRLPRAAWQFDGEAALRDAVVPVCMIADTGRDALVAAVSQAFSGPLRSNRTVSQNGIIGHLAQHLFR